MGISGGEIMMGFRFVCLLLCAVVACMVLPAQLDGATELVEVPSVPTTMEQMKDMINGAMKHTMKEDLGEGDGASTQADMKATMDEIAEREAIADEMMVEEKRDCVMTQWTEWSKCDKKCGGGEIARSRKIRISGQNGGEECPDEEGLKESSSCNTESCSEQQLNLEKQSRHLTEEEIAKETKYNNRVLRRAMNAPDVGRMVNVLAPKEKPPTDEELIQDDLKKAMAKNTVDTAVAGFEKTQETKEGSKKTEGDKKGGK